MSSAGHRKIIVAQQMYFFRLVLEHFTRKLFSSLEKKSCLSGNAPVYNCKRSAQHEELAFIICPHKFQICGIKLGGKKLITDLLSTIRYLSYLISEGTCMFENCGAGNESEAVHTGVVCDGCNMAPISGPRYKCLTCPDYDLCKNCEGTGVHVEHDMIKITTPGSIPAFPFGPGVSNSILQ